MNKIKILIVEDDPNLGIFLLEYLEVKNYEISLQNFIDLKDQINFGKYKIFDYRINNQIILK